MQELTRELHEALSRASKAESELKASQAEAGNSKSALALAKSTEAELRAECETVCSSMIQLKASSSNLMHECDSLRNHCAGLESKLAEHARIQEQREREHEQHASSLAAELESTKHKLKAAADVRCPSGSSHTAVEVAGVRQDLALANNTIMHQKQHINMLQGMLASTQNMMAKFQWSHTKPTTLTDLELVK